MVIDLIVTVRALLNMLSEMYKKELELKRLTKTSSLLIMSGLLKSSIFDSILSKVLKEQQKDGGWISILDTVWNIKFLQLIDRIKYETEIKNGIRFLNLQKNQDGLWGRSKRDISRIPVTGIIFYLLPELATKTMLFSLEELWEKEKNSIVYKAGYILMAFKKNNYIPKNHQLIKETCYWLQKNQRKDNGFAPWIEHPIDSNVFCTAIGALGLLQYPDFAKDEILKKCFEWLINHRLSTGVWKYHEIEDGASWGLYAMSKLIQSGYMD